MTELPPSKRQRFKLKGSVTGSASKASIRRAGASLRQTGTSSKNLRKLKTVIQGYEKNSNGTKMSVTTSQGWTTQHQQRPPQDEEASTPLMRSSHGAGISG